jgi:hypothetical protein
VKALATAGAQIKELNMIRTFTLATIVKSAGLAALGLSLAAAAGAQPAFNPAPLVIPCGVGPVAPCSGAGRLPASSGSRVVADILNRNAAAQRNMQQGLNRLREIIQDRQAARDRERAYEPREDRNRNEAVSYDPGVATNNDKRLPGYLPPGTPAWDLPYAAEDGDGLYEYASPAVSAGLECSARRSIYYPTPTFGPSGCVSKLDAMTTYYPAGRSYTSGVPSFPETVIDGSKIPCIIDFSGLNPVPTCGQNPGIPSHLEFPGAADPNLDIFQSVHKAYQRIAKEQDLGR